MGADADVERGRDKPPAVDGPPRQREDGEQLPAAGAGIVHLPPEVLPALEELAELLDTVVVHARTCGAEPLGDDAQRWSVMLRKLLEQQRSTQ